MNKIQYTLVDTEAQFAPLLHLLQQQQGLYLAIDTEFVRTSTFYADLGLIQIFDGKQCFLLDPLAFDLSEFWPALRQHHWILHAFSEDLEILYRHAGGLGLSVFDTQVACAFLGHGASMGFQRFIEHELSILLDKGESRTDWIARPLRQAQLDYAAADVWYLLPAYQGLIKQLKEKNLLAKVQEECSRMAVARGVQLEADKAYLEVKNTWRLNPQQLSVLKILASWRLKLAKQKNMAINRVVKGESLFELALHQPKGYMQLQNMALPPQEFRRYNKQFLSMIDEAKQIPESDYPPAVKRMIDYSGYKAKMQSLKVILEKVAEQSEIPQDVLATKKILHEYLQWLWEGQGEAKPLLLSGWRAELFETVLRESESD